MAPVLPVLPDLSIRQLEYLVAVVDAPTWATAAGRVGVSPSALSQGLAELERRIGVPLFERVGRRRVLRTSADPVLAHARQVVAITGDLARWADRARRADEGQLRLGMLDVAAVHHYPETLAAFRSAHPDLQLHLRVGPSGTLLDLLAAGELDLAVCVQGAEARRGITSEPILTEQLAIYRPDGKRAGHPPGWGPWVLFPDGSHTRAVVADELSRLGAPLNIVAESHQPEVLREMVLLGLGWTVLPVVQAETGDRALTRARILTERTLIAAVRDTPVLDPAVAALQAVLVNRPRTAPG
jgi:DNA-binding transcriptional LysR family regulator